MWFLLTFEGDGTVEYRLLRCAVGVYVEVTDTLELKVTQMRQVGSPFFNVGVVVYAQ